MSEITDRIKAVIAKTLDEHQEWLESGECAKAEEACARNILLAIREPTDAMCDAATRSTSAWLNSKLKGVELRRLKLRIRWGAMIDAALKS